MVAVVPGYEVSTGYGVPGNWSGGRHGGVDYAAPTGAKVVAPWAGRVTGLSWGNSYGVQVVIDFDRLPDGSPGLWGVIAHLSKRSVLPGQRVAVGQKIGEVGSTGNSTGPHAHFEVQNQANWVSGTHVNPQPWLDAGTPGPPPATKWKHPAGTKVFRSKAGFDAHETNPDRHSVSIECIQEMLNAHSMPGGRPLPVTGKYWIATDAEVRLCQRLHVPPEDTARRSFVGPDQFAHLKKETGAPYVWVDDGPYVPPGEPVEPPEEVEDWHVPASLRALRAEIDLRWPDRDRSSDGTIGDEAHQRTKSEHNPVGHPNGPEFGTPGAVHAMDITAEGIDTGTVAGALIGDHRVWYVIFAGSIWSKTYGWEKRPYTGADPHNMHIHVSLAADDQLSAVRNEMDAGEWMEGPALPPGGYVTRDEWDQLHGDVADALRRLADTLE